MSLATLFGKLHEHEMELMRLNQHEENEKKNKIQGYQRKTNKNIYIFHNEHQGMKGMGNI